MDPLSVTLILKFVTGAIISALIAWPWILNFLSTKLIPWLRESVSETIADLLADVLIFADKGIVLVRRTAKQLWKYLKQNILGINLKVEKTSATTALGKTTTFIRDEHGKVIQTVATETLGWEDLPDAIRSEITRQNTSVAEMDLKQPLEDKFKKQAMDQGMELELTN
ncbi:MAG TPA: hypothetical protein VIW67_13330 [Terriglobales bacterium]|jgi:hypothetical protein